jgi:hypothetical protein
MRGDLIPVRCNELFGGTWAVTRNIDYVFALSFDSTSLLFVGEAAER